MRLAHHLLRHASGVFHFRLIVPADLQVLLGRRVIKQSLGGLEDGGAGASAAGVGASAQDGTDDGSAARLLSTVIHSLSMICCLGARDCRG